MENKKSYLSLLVWRNTKQTQKLQQFRKKNKINIHSLLTTKSTPVMGRDYCALNAFLFYRGKFVSFNVNMITTYVCSPVNILYWYLALWGMPFVALNKEARNFIREKVEEQRQYFVDLAKSAKKWYSDKLSTKKIAGFVIQALYEKKNRCFSCWKQPKRLFIDYLSGMPMCPGCLSTKYVDKNGVGCPNGADRRETLIETDLNPFRYVIICFNNGHKDCTCFHYCGEVCFTKYKRKDPGEGITLEEIPIMRAYKKSKNKIN